MNSKTKNLAGQVNGGGAAQAAGAQAAAFTGGNPTVNADVSAPACIPINNMGENYGDAEHCGFVDLVLTDSGKTKTVMIRKPAQDQLCIVDWINFTVLDETWFRTARQTLVTDEEIISEASRYLEKIFGFGITEQRATGINFYKSSWILGDDMGFVGFGGQRQTMCITLTGQGCTNAHAGWEKRLHEFLTTIAVRPSISRLDLAHDDLTGSYLSVDWAESQWHEGGYSMAVGGRPPSIERIGNWHRPSGKGRTLTIGLRTSGKFCRFYEKGKKEGDKLSTWTRCEVEFKNSDRVIPFDALLNPSDFFVAAYPCFSEFAHVVTPRRMEIKKKTAQIVIDDCVEIVKRQFGKYINQICNVYGDKEGLEMMRHPDKNAWPKRMKPLTATAETGGVPIHKQAAIPSFLEFIQAVPSFGLNRENFFPESNHYAMEH